MLNKVGRQLIEDFFSRVAQLLNTGQRWFPWRRCRVSGKHDFRFKPQTDLRARLRKAFKVN